MTLEVENFHNSTKNISGILAQLLSAKQIIRDNHENTFITKVCALCQVLSECLDRITKVLIPWTLYVAQDSAEPISFIEEVTALTREMVPFDRNVRALTSEIRAILTTEASNSKSRRAQEEQEEGDRSHGTSNWPGRCLATAAQARDVLQKVDDATEAMWKLSNELGTGLMRYDGRPGESFGSKSREETELECFPADPFLVSERILTMVSTKLSSEIIRLDNLAGSKQAVNLN